MKFIAYGHPNIMSTHKNTFEFTKDKEVTKSGDCIVGVNADFSMQELKKILSKKSIKIQIMVGDTKETITAIPNPDFNSNHEIVVRKTGFISKRTLAINADKAANDFIIKDKLKNPAQKIIVEML